MSPLFADFADHVVDELEDRADQLVGAIDAVVEFGRPTADGIYQLRFEAVKLRALTVTLAAAIGSPHQDKDHHAEILGMVIEELHRELGLDGVQTIAGLKRLWRTGVDTGRILQAAEQATGASAH